jgi:hypothetical protein
MSSRESRRRPAVAGAIARVLIVRGQHPWSAVDIVPAPSLARTPAAARD